jgi:hypothetical protein
MKSRQNFLSVNGKTARSSYGEFFEVGELVGHQDTDAGQATVLSFQGIIRENEVKVFTDKGYCHLDFLVKLETVTT